MGLLIAMAAVVGAIGGFVYGQLLFPVIGLWVRGPWWGVWMTVIGIIGFVALWKIKRRFDGEDGGYSRLEKGEKAEVRVGSTIERAIAAPGCAVAHSVMEISKVGDIDHLVATPVGVWVIETKFKRVPKSEFPKVLKRIEMNTKGVREWVRPGTLVRGCLALAYEEDSYRRYFMSGDERIVAQTPDSLARELSTAAARKLVVDGKVAGDVWKLGEVREAESVGEDK